MDSSQSSIKNFILEQKCSKHNILCEFLNLDPKSAQCKVCLFCMEEEKIPLEKVMPIHTLLSMDPSTKFPVFVRNFSLLKLIDCDFNLPAILNEIEKYFTELCDTLQKAIYKLLDQEKEKIQNYISELKKSQQSLENLLSIKEIQELLLSSQSNSEEHLTEYIKKQNSDYNNLFEELMKKNQEFDQFQSTFSSKQPLQQEKQIVSLINSINFYTDCEKTWIFPQIRTYQKIQGKKLSFILATKQNGGLFLFQNPISMILVNDSIVITNKQGKIEQWYLNKVLTRQPKYIIRLQFNKKYANKSLFRCGLMSSNEINIKTLNNSDKIYFCSEYGGTMKTIKGSDLFQVDTLSFQIHKEVISLEIRIDIQNKIWKIASFPDYMNVSQLEDPQVINPSNMYYFAIQIQGEQSELIIQEVTEVMEFDNKM